MVLKFQKATLNSTKRATPHSSLSMVRARPKVLLLRSKMISDKSIRSCSLTPLIKRRITPHSFHRRLYLVRVVTPLHRILKTVRPLRHRSPSKDWEITRTWLISSPTQPGLHGPSTSCSVGQVTSPSSVHIRLHEETSTSTPPSLSSDVYIRFRCAPTGSIQTDFIAPVTMPSSVNSDNPHTRGEFDTVMTALKAAVNGSTDHATLKAALLSALAAY